MSRGGRFITFEGIEGCGKTTQLRRCAAALRASGADVTTTREPGGTELGLRLREALLSSAGTPPTPAAELLLYVADRAEHVERVIRPALERGAIVLCDRYADATAAYQGYARGLGLERVLALHAAPPLDLQPDRTVLFDLDVDAALGRARRREAGGASGGEDRFENEALAFHRRVREGYLELARRDPDRIRVVDAAGDEAAVARRVAAALADLLPELEAA
jgi:dTMP kinase